VLVTSHGFHGATIASRHSIAMTAIAARAPAWSATTISPRRCTPPTLKARRRSAAAPASGRSSASTRAKSQPAACRWCSIPESRVRWSPSRKRGERQFDRAQNELSAGKARREDFCARHRYHRRSAAAARPAFATIRRRRRRWPPDQIGRRRCTQDLAARLRDRTRARSRNDRPRSARRFLDPSPGASNLNLAPAAKVRSS